MLEILNEGDRISLVEFNNYGNRLCPLSCVSKDNLDFLKEKIQNISAKGGTNINEGMEIAFDILKQRKMKNKITSIFLLSDGLDEDLE